jgi:hypothetical protein
MAEEEPQGSTVYRGATREEAERAYHADARGRAQAGFVPVSEEWSTALGQQLLAVRYRYDPSATFETLRALGQVAAESKARDEAETVGHPSAPTTEFVPPPPIQPPVGKASGGARRGWLVLGVVIFLAIVAAAAFLGATNSGLLTPHHTIKGTFALIDTTGNALFPSITSTGGVCQGSGGYGDISPGISVVIKDGDGKTLATTQLGSGSGGSTRCDFAFDLENVPEVAFYSIEISHRGALSYSLADMKAMDWSLDLTLGK